MRVQDIMTAVQSLTKSSIVEIDCNRGLRPVVGSLKNKLLPYLDHVSNYGLIGNKLIIFIFKNKKKANEHIFKCCCN